MLSARATWFVRASLPPPVIVVPFAIFFSALTPDAVQPKGPIRLAHIGAVMLAGGVVTMGVGLLRTPSRVAGSI